MDRSYIRVLFTVYWKHKTNKKEKKKEKPKNKINKKQSNHNRKAAEEVAKPKKARILPTGPVQLGLLVACNGRRGVSLPPAGGRLDRSGYRQCQSGHVQVCAQRPRNLPRASMALRDWRRRTTARRSSTTMMPNRHPSSPPPCRVSRQRRRGRAGPRRASQPHLRLGGVE